MAALVAAGITAGVLAATGAFSGAGATRSPGGHDGISSAQTNAVLNILHRYAAAFTNRNPGALGALMTPNITRLGRRPPTPGCYVQTGLQNVLGAEQANFGGAYRFVGLSSGEVQIAGNTAMVSTSYAISSGGSGPIRFVLVNGTGGWLITRIDANC